jgi:hypothetical protein
MSPFGEELAIFIVSHQLFGISYRRRPVETCSESLSDQRSGGRVVATGSNVYVLEEFYTIILGDALHQNLYVCILHESAVYQ